MSEGRDTEQQLLRDIDRKVTRLETLMENVRSDQGNYVSKDEFRPVKLIVYGAVALILSSVAGGIIALVITVA